MSEETEVLTVEGLAKLLGRTEASIRRGFAAACRGCPRASRWATGTAG